MPQFKYKAISSKGKVSEGTSSAKDAGALASVLAEQGLFLMESRVVADADLLGPAPAGKQAPAGAGPAPVSLDATAAAYRGDSVSYDSLASFVTQFSIMVRTALPILEALQTLARQQPDRVLRAALEEVYKSVRAGQSLSSAFGKFPNIFDQVFVSLVATGEASGNLPLMLERIAMHLNFIRNLRQGVRSALLYPVIVVLTAAAVVGFLVVFILPIFADVFLQFEVPLPWPTRALLGLSAHVRALWWGYVFGGGLLAWWVRSRLESPGSAAVFDKMLLDLPVVGRMARAVVLTRVLRTLAALAGSGVPILRSLELTRNAAGNAVYSEVVGRVYRSAAAGQGLSAALSGSEYIPAQVSNMVGNAERTGTLPETLNKVADYYEAEVTVEIKNLFSVIEPILVVLLGLVVGAIAVAILLPIFNISQAVQ